MTFVWTSFELALGMPIELALTGTKASTTAKTSTLPRNLSIALALHNPLNPSIKNLSFGDTPTRGVPCLPAHDQWISMIYLFIASVR
jgi:hypothetical protein